MKHNSKVIDFISILISTFFYTGYVPYGPGTAGTFISFILYLLFIHNLNPFIYLVFCFLLFILGVYFSSRAEKLFGVKDPSKVVIDEALGYFLTMTGAFFAPFSIINAIAGFLLFRFFDILKPYPIKYIDRNLSGGIGIMLDDVVAAIFSAILLRIIMVIILGL